MVIGTKLIRNSPMTIVVLKLPDVKQKTEERPKKCPYCEGTTFQRWGKVKKKVRDVHVRSVTVYRYRCGHCQRSFRHYPAGSSSADQTKRLEIFSVLLWTLGLSYRAAELILSGLKVSLSFMTIWRNAQEENVKRKKQKQWQPVRALGLDGAYVQGWGEKQPVLVAVDLGTGDPLAVGYVNEYDPQAVQRWLKPLVQRHGVSVIVTDDLCSDRGVADKLQLGHQVCQFHVRRWVGRTLHDLASDLSKEWLWVLEEARTLLEVLHPEGGKRLYALWKQLPGRQRSNSKTLSPLERLRDLLLRLAQTWQRYCTFQSEPQVPWTNNTTERAIERMKMRARTVRGYKSWQGMETGLLLAAAPFL
ncbi:MAG: transposase [Chloroflexi bacterium]|nr:transposase [Chloroflexota bacterium]MDL1941720.1 transposase [Chloroflexi bacterium CFX2]